MKAAVDASLPASKAKAEEDQRKAKENLESLKLEVAVAETGRAATTTAAELEQVKNDLHDRTVLAHRTARQAGLGQPYPRPEC